MHLPLDFHHLAIYVLDEDTVGCVVGGWGVHGDPKSHANLHTKKKGAASNPRHLSPRLYGRVLALV